MQNNLEMKSCQNCSWFCQHYSKQGTAFGKVCCGHCLCHERKSRRRQLAVCEFWQPMQIQKEQRRQSIKDYLVVISQRIDEVYEILKDDEQG